MAKLKLNLAGRYLVMFDRYRPFQVSENNREIYFSKDTVSDAVSYVYDTIGSAVFLNKKVYKTKTGAIKAINAIY